MPLNELRAEHANFFETMVKAVVDLEKEWIAVDAEMHADLEKILLEENSQQGNLWGFNIFWGDPYRIEFTSLINIRPAQGNRGMEVTDPVTRQKIEIITRKLIQ